MAHIYHFFAQPLFRRQARYSAAPGFDSPERDGFPGSFQRWIPETPCLAGTPVFSFPQQINSFPPQSLCDPFVYPLTNQTPLTQKFAKETVSFFPSAMSCPTIVASWCFLDPHLIGPSLPLFQLNPFLNLGIIKPPSPMFPDPHPLLTSYLVCFLNIEENSA